MIISKYQHLFQTLLTYNSAPPESRLDLLNGYMRFRLVDTTPGLACRHLEKIINRERSKLPCSTDNSAPLTSPPA